MATLPSRGTGGIHPFPRLLMLLAALLIAACADDVIGLRVIKEGELPPDELASLVYRIDIDPPSDTLGVGDMVELHANAYARTSTGVDLTVTDATFFTWSSQDSLVATVDTTGHVQGRSAGATQVLASVGSQQVAAAIVVRDGAAATIAVHPDSVALVVGDSAQLSVTSSAAIAAGDVAWTTSDAGVATVGAAGMVKARGAGVAWVRGTYGASRDSARVYVEAPPPSPAPGGLIAAFPGAEGFGAVALNDCDRRNLEVLAVTNVNDAGAGSLRDAVSRSDPAKLSVIVFRRGGTIMLSNAIFLNRSCLYIAGQTAPGGGIQLRGPDDVTHRIVPFRFPRDRTGHDVVIRYLRVRAGRGDPGAQDNISIDAGYNIVIDHVSTAWGNDESISISPVKLDLRGQESDHITIQHSIVAATLRPHSTGSIIGGDVDEPDVWAISVHHNAYVHNAHRNPLIRRVKCIEVVNNVVYNWKSRVGNSYGDTCIDFVGNYYKRGPWSGTALLRHVIGTTVGTTEDPHLYMVGNVADPMQLDPNADQTRLIEYFGEKTGPLPASAFVRAKQASPLFPVRLSTSAAAAYSSVLATAGASRRLTCAGAWVNARDRVDQLFVSQIQNGGGPSTDAESDHQDDYGGFPALSAGTACADTDGDGMPDEYEALHGLNAGDRSDAAKDADGDGYTNLEEYLSGSAPR